MMLFPCTKVVACLSRGGRIQGLLRSVGVSCGVGILASLAFAQDESPSKPRDLARIVADRLAVSEAEVFSRGNELKRAHTDGFETQLQHLDNHVAELAKRLADRERRSAAVAKGVAATGDAGIEDTKSRLRHDEMQIHSITAMYDEIAPILIFEHLLIANVVGALNAQSDEATRDSSASPKSPEVDIDAHGIEKSISNLNDLRIDVEGRYRELETRLKVLKNQVRPSQDEIEDVKKGANKHDAEVLLQTVLRDVDLTDEAFDKVLDAYGRDTASRIGLFERQSVVSIENWRRPSGAPGLAVEVVDELASAFEKAMKTEKEADRQVALDAVSQTLQKRSNLLKTFRLAIDRAAAVELEGNVVLLLQESRSEIVRLRKAKAVSTDASREPSLNLKEATLSERVAITIPRIQQVHKVVRRCREMWLR